MTLLRPTSEMLAKIDRLLAAPRGHRIGVLGLGVAGKAMALHLACRQAHVLGLDAKTTLPAAEELRQAGVELCLGNILSGATLSLEALVISPGADPRQPLVQALVEQGAPLFGELELVGHLPAKVVGITGTNGKSTTTGLLGALLRGVGQRVFVGGNFGEPIVSWLDRGEPTDTAVVELSSFQLETAYRFRADVAVVLNLTPDHLDRYASLAEYGLAKQRLCENLAPNDVAVLSYDDVHVRRMAEATRARVFWFSTRAQTLPGDGAYLDGDAMVGVGALADLGRLELGHPRLFGRHNRENAIAALLAAHALGVTDTRDLVRAYGEFRGLEHRLELAGEIRGVRFVNDSKATNDDAAAIGVTAMDRPVVLLLGGRGKGGGYNGLLAAASGRVRAVIAYGEARAEIAEAFAQHDNVQVVTTSALAFRAAVAEAKPGEVVLLSPACASFDEFKDYTERGRTFKGWVRELAEGNLP